MIKLLCFLFRSIFLLPVFVKTVLVSDIRGTPPATNYAPSSLPSLKATEINSQFKDDEQLTIQTTDHAEGGGQGKRGGGGRRSNIGILAEENLSERFNGFAPKRLMAPFNSHSKAQLLWRSLNKHFADSEKQTTATQNSNSANPMGDGNSRPNIPDKKSSTFKAPGTISVYRFLMYLLLRDVFLPKALNNLYNEKKAETGSESVSNSKSALLKDLLKFGIRFLKTSSILEGVVYKVFTKLIMKDFHVPQRLRQTEHMDGNALLHSLLTKEKEYAEKAYEKFYRLCKLIFHKGKEHEEECGCFCSAVRSGYREKLLENGYGVAIAHYFRYLKRSVLTDFIKIASEAVLKDLEKEGYFDKDLPISTWTEIIEKICYESDEERRLASAAAPENSDGKSQSVSLNKQKENQSTWKAPKKTKVSSRANINQENYKGEKSSL